MDTRTKLIFILFAALAAAVLFLGGMIAGITCAVDLGVASY